MFMNQTIWNEIKKVKTSEFGRNLKILILMIILYQV